MSEKTVLHLKEYVRDGGNLFATFETSLHMTPEFGVTTLLWQSSLE
jgi:hypothetical protein